MLVPRSRKLWRSALLRPIGLASVSFGYQNQVDLITAINSLISTKDIIYYMLNGLSSSYESFKTTIRTNPQPLSLDDLYSLLCNEETTQQSEAAWIKQTTPIALAVNHSFSCERNSNFNNRGHSNLRRGRGCGNGIECQICGKLGHSIFSCSHCTNMQYTPRSKFEANAANSSTVE